MIEIIQKTKNEKKENQKLRKKDKTTKIIFRDDKNKTSILTGHCSKPCWKPALKKNTFLKNTRKLAFGSSLNKMEKVTKSEHKWLSMAGFQNGF